VQHTCSQLIKEGLKLTIQTKRRNTGRHLENLDSPRNNKMARREEVSSQDYDYDDLFSPGVGVSQTILCSVSKMQVDLYPTDQRLPFQLFHC
jgi:hypothetical protein